MPLSKGASKHTMHFLLKSTSIDFTSVSELQKWTSAGVSKLLKKQTPAEVQRVSASISYSEERPSLNDKSREASYFGIVVQWTKTCRKIKK